MSAGKSTGATPLNFGVQYPNTRRHAAIRDTEIAEQTEGETINLEQATIQPSDCGDLNLTNNENSNNLTINQHFEQLPESSEIQNIIMASSIQLQKFSDETTCVPSIWWDLFESYQVCISFDKEKAVASLPFHLNGRALLWYHNLDNGIKKDFDRMKAAFLERFTCHKTNKQIYKLQQTDKETGSQYLTRVQQLAMGADDLSESAIVDLAMNGLNKTLRTFVVGRDPKTFDELRQAIDIATNVSECNTNNSASATCTSASTSVNDINSMFASFLDSMRTVMQQEVMALKPPDRITDQGTQQEFFCRGCGKSCRVRRQCPAYNAKCHSCGIIGHYQDVCGQKGKNW